MGHGPWWSEACQRMLAADVERWVNSQSETWLTGASPRRAVSLAMEPFSVTMLVVRQA